jgi:hypothetical protein
MSRRERETRVPLDGLSGEQLSILREGASSHLIGAAGDLRLLANHDDPERAVREVAALGRLNFWLHHGEVLVPDRTVRELVARRTTETIYLDELKETYDRELAEQEAWLALLAHFATGAEDDRRAGRG